MSDIVPQSDLPDQSSVVPSDDLPSHIVPPEDMPSVEASAEQPQNGLLSATEGAMRGLTGGLSDAVFSGARHVAESLTDNPELQDILAPKTQDVANRADTTVGKIGEGVAVAGSLLTGTGVPGLISKGAKAIVPEATGMLAKVGSGVLRGVAEGVALQSGDELSRTMLGKGDPENAVAPALVRMGGAGLLGGFVGGVFNALGQSANKGLATLENAKLGDKAEKILAGMGVASKAHAAGIPFEDAEKFANDYYKNLGAGEMFNYADYKDGVKLYYKGLQTAVNTVTRAGIDAIAGGIAEHTMGPASVISVGVIADKVIAPLVEKVLQKPLLRANKYVIPSVLYALEQGQTKGLFNLLNHTESISRGVKAINSGVESLFKAGSQQSINDFVSDKDIKAIKSYIDAGGINQEMQDASQQAPAQGQEQQYAKGGHVSAPPDSGSISSLYPEQAMMMSAAKGRMSNYLNSLKPQQNPMKLPYDRAPDQREQHKAYDEAVNIAAAPLSVLKHVKNGTLQLDHMKHLNGMYPELTQHLQKKLTARMMQAQLEDEKPRGKTKQAMALFLGAPLETYQTPTSIMAAQAVFAPKQAPQPQGKPAGSTKKGTTNLGKSNKSYQTPEQAAENYKSNRK